jgi:hypothetical protein
MSDEQRTALSRSSVQKSGGTTKSERYLASLCERSFLSLWSYPNVYRDQGCSGGKGNGKEICDVLVVFNQHVLIFSDKACEFPDKGNDKIDWARWFRRAVQKSADQVYGAERWLRLYPDRVFIDADCTQSLPIQLPPPETARFHRIVVALNAAPRCKKYFNDSGSGSLIIRPETVGDQHLEQPFRIGQLDPAKGYVHVFDDVTLDVVLRELDTITDFTRYLTRKEALIASGKLVAAAGEEELLAHYLTVLNEDGDHDFVLPKDVTAALFAEGDWQDFTVNAQYIRKKGADKQSYAWDKLIEVFSKHIASGTLERGNDRPIAEDELAVRIMASEPRLVRRNLAAALIDLLETTPRDKDKMRHVLSELSGTRVCISCEGEAS